MLKYTLALKKVEYNAHKYQLILRGKISNIYIRHLHKTINKRHTNTSFSEVKSYEFVPYLHQKKCKLGIEYGAFFGADVVHKIRPR